MAGGEIISTYMMIGLCIFFLLLAVVAGFERNWPMAVYGLGALILNIAVVWWGFISGPR